MTSLHGILQAADKLEEMVMDLDPDFTHSFVIRGKIRQSLDPYRQLLREKKADARQSRMEDFFSSRPSTSQQLPKRPRLTSPTTNTNNNNQGEGHTTITKAEFSVSF